MHGTGSTPPTDRLAHVYWIGGSPCSGKSSIAARLAERHDLRVYACDDAFARHARAVTREAQPAFHRITRLTWDAIWMRPVDVLLGDEIDVYREEWPLILDDLLALPGDRLIIAEGAALMPRLVCGVLADPRRAVWIVPTEAFQRERYPRRGAWVGEILAQCADPEQALRNWMDRDVAFARTVRAEAERLGLRVLTVDGERTVDENAARVEAHLRL